MATALLGFSLSVTLQPGANVFNVTGSVNGCSASDSMVVYYTPPPPQAQKDAGHPSCPSNGTNPINGASGNKFQAEMDYVGSGRMPLAFNTPEVLVAEPNDVTQPEVVPSQTPEALPSGTQSEAYNICLRATQRFEQQEKANLKGNGKTVMTSLSASCKTELKPSPYWLCMEKAAIGEVDFNTAHWRCAKQTKLLN